METASSGLISVSTNNSKDLCLSSGNKQVEPSEKTKDSDICDDSQKNVEKRKKNSDVDKSILDVFDQITKEIDDAKSEMNLKKSEIERIEIIIKTYEELLRLLKPDNTMCENIKGELAKCRVEIDDLQKGASHYRAKLKKRNEIILKLYYKNFQHSATLDCPICLTNRITHTLSCGHCYCESCLSQQQYHNKCAICNLVIVKKIKLFI